MDQETGRRVYIEHVSYAVEDAELLAINGDALIYRDEDGEHMFKVDDVPLICFDERDITDEYLDDFKRKVKIKAVVVYSLIFSLPSLIALGIWCVIR